MKKLFRPQDHLLLGLAGIVDIYNDLKDPLGVMKKVYGEYGWVPSLYKKTNYYGAVYRVLKTGYIEKVIKNSEPYIRLSTKGWEKTKRDFPIARWQNEKWDGKWRVVIFDIKEKERKNRDFLRRKLKELGFGMIQESVWVSPYDVAIDFREFVKSFGLGEQVFVMEISHLLAGDARALAAKIWSLEKINERYKDLWEKLKFLHDRVGISTNRASEGGSKDKKVERKKAVEEIKSEFIEILRDDPCLPKELLPKDWYGEKIRKLLRF